MQNESLKSTLKSLQTQLAQLDRSDPEVRELLTELDHDIRNLIAQNGSPPDATDALLSERTQALSARFAARHPQLEPILRDLGNLLSSMGI